MGGASYDRDVYSSGSSTSSGGFSSGSSRSSSGFSYSKAAAEALNDSQLNSDLFPKRRDLTCIAKTGIVIVLDHTGSMGDAAKTMYDKMPMFYGQIEKQGYLEDFAISFAAVGDVNSDDAPLQVCEFAKGKELDKWLKKIYLEGGGGGQQKESYELMALYYLRHANFTNPDGTKPFIFFIGDEAFYDKVTGYDVKKHFGDGEKAKDLASKKIFQELREKYNAFMLHVPYSCERDPGDPKRELVVSSRPSADREIAAQWKELFREDFMVVKEPKAIVDVILGCIAMASDTRDLDAYLDDMKGRDQSTRRIERVEEILRPKSDALAITKVTSALPVLDGGKDRGGRSQRL